MEPGGLYGFESVVHQVSFMKNIKYRQNFIPMV